MTEQEGNAHASQHYCEAIRISAFP